jgi:hypothetical protein
VYFLLGVGGSGYNPSYTEGSNQENHSLKSAQANSLQDNISKISMQSRAGGVVQVVEDLPSKCETLSSNASTKKKNKKKLNSNMCLNL